MPKTPSVEGCGYFVQQLLTPPVTEQNGFWPAWIGPALSDTSDAQSFSGTMLLPALQNPFIASLSTVEA